MASSRSRTLRGLVLVASMPCMAACDGVGDSPLVADGGRLSDVGPPLADRGASDAGLAGADVVQSVPDAGPDARRPGPDAAVPFPDASIPLDAAVPFPDASIPLDAAVPFPDASIPLDAATPDLGPNTTAFVRVPTPGRWAVSNTSSFPVTALVLEDVEVRNGQAFIGRLSVELSGLGPLLAGVDLPVADDGTLVLEVADFPDAGTRARLEARIRAPDFLCGTFSAELPDGTLPRTQFGARLEGSRFPPAASCDGVVCGGSPWPSRVCSPTCGVCPGGFFCDAERVHADEPMPPVCWPGDGCPVRVAACQVGASCGVLELATVCQFGGHAAEGAPCEVAVRGVGTPCEAGLVCHEQRCSVPCDPANPCGAPEVCGRLELESWGFGLCVGECDVVTGEACDAGLVCHLERRYGAIVGICRPDQGGVAVGAACDPDAQDCRPGLLCDQPQGRAAAVCHVPCTRAAPVTCRADETCADGGLFFSDLWGLCRSTCDPMGANTCSPGEACGTLSVAESEDGSIRYRGTCLPAADLIGEGGNCRGGGGLCGPGLVCRAMGHPRRGIQQCVVP